MSLVLNSLYTFICTYKTSAQTEDCLKFRFGVDMSSEETMPHIIVEVRIGVVAVLQS